MVFSPQVEFVPDLAEGFRKMLGKPDNELRGFVFQKLFLLVAGEVREAQVFVFLPAADAEVATVKISVCHGSLVTKNSKKRISNITISRMPAIRYIAFFSDRLSSLQMARQILKILKQWMIIFCPHKNYLFFLDFGHCLKHS